MNRPAAAFPWTDAIAYGLGGLRLSSAAFWSMSVREFITLANARTTARRVLGAADLSRLMAAYPDRDPAPTKDTENDR